MKLCCLSVYEDVSLIQVRDQLEVEIYLAYIVPGNEGFTPLLSAGNHAG